LTRKNPKECPETSTGKGPRPREKGTYRGGEELEVKRDVGGCLPV